MTIFKEMVIVIKQIRQELGLSQQQLAIELHVGFSTVNRWENAHTKPNGIARHAILELCKKNTISEQLLNDFVSSI